jgi:hypothetical protein
VDAEIAQARIQINSVLDCGFLQKVIEAKYSVQQLLKEAAE